MLRMGMAPVLQDYRVNNLPARDTFPLEKIVAIIIKFFVDHHSSTSIAPHAVLRIYPARLLSPDRLQIFYYRVLINLLQGEGLGLYPADFRNR